MLFRSGLRSEGVAGKEQTSEQEGGKNKRSFHGKKIISCPTGRQKNEMVGMKERSACFFVLIEVVKSLQLDCNFPSLEE